MLKEKQKGGITLISLVITIVVLLILAVVAISIAIDSNGIFGRARYAADTWNDSVEKESTAIENALEVADEILGPVLPDGWNTNYVADVITEGTRIVPIPKGYTASKIVGEDKISDGLVIYEGEPPVTGEKDGEEHKVAMKDRNQYVWIPVDDINDMVMCQKCGANGKLTFDVTNNILQCETCKEETKLAGKLYATAGGENFNAELKGQTYNADSGLREPANLTDETYGDASETGIAAIKEILEEAYPEKEGTYKDEYESIEDDWLELQQKNFYEMAKSVAKYKGFYISRYEIQEGAASKKGATVLNAETANMWYGLYTTIQNSASPESTVAQMIWGSQYDQVMMFVDEKNGYDVQTVVPERHHSSGLEKSGENDNDIACNIYDLEGNYFEQTSEAGITTSRIFRGRWSQRQFFRILPLQPQSDGSLQQPFIACYTLCSSVMLVEIQLA